LSLETESSEVPSPASGSPREQELEAKLNRRTMWVGLFAFVALTELIIMVEVLRQAS
jgi:hypothetical protein